MRRWIAASTVLVAAVAVALADETKPAPEKGTSVMQVSVPGMT